VDEGAAAVSQHQQGGSMVRGERRGSLSSQSDDDEDDEKCPLCCEDLDVTDRNFFPCSCGYQARGVRKKKKTVPCLRVRVGGVHSFPMNRSFDRLVD
jgi:hypothetical protein